MRLIEHPGPVAAQRSLVAWGEAGPSCRLTLAPGEDFINGLVREAKTLGVWSAGVVLLGGCIARLAFMTGRPVGPAEAEGRVATHSGPHEIACPARIVGGQAVLGRDAAGAPLVHCHALFVDAGGRARGGHLVAGTCIAGPGGIRLQVTTLDGAGFRTAHDRETGFDIFHPARSQGQPTP